MNGDTSIPGIPVEHMMAIADQMRVGKHTNGSLP